MSDPLRPDLSFEVRPGSRLARSPAIEQLRRYLTSLLSEGFPPSVSLAVLEQGDVALQAFGGYACVVGQPVPTAFETSYDLASLTKVVCTVTLALMASEQGALDLDDPVVRWLPDYPQQLTTLRHLLTHTAGLVDHRPFHATLRGRPRSSRPFTTWPGARRLAARCVTRTSGSCCLGGCWKPVLECPSTKRSRLWWRDRWG